MAGDVKKLLSALDPDVRPWFKKKVEKDYWPLADLAEKLKECGYALDSCGLMFREKLTEEEQKKAGHTILDVAFLRPSDYHSHPDVAELVEVLDGKGSYFVEGALQKVEPGMLIYTRENIRHAWVPEPANYLAIHVCCSGVLDLKKEETYLSFEDLETYLTKFRKAIKNEA